MAPCRRKNCAPREAQMLPRFTGHGGTMASAEAGAGRSSRWHCTKQLTLRSADGERGGGLQTSGVHQTKPRRRLITRVFCLSTRCCPCSFSGYITSYGKNWGSFELGHRSFPVTWQGICTPYRLAVLLLLTRERMRAEGAGGGNDPDPCPNRTPPPLLWIWHRARKRLVNR